MSIQTDFHMGYGLFLYLLLHLSSQREIRPVAEQKTTRKQKQQYNRPNMFHVFLQTWTIYGKCVCCRCFTHSQAHSIRFEIIFRAPNAHTLHIPHSHWIDTVIHYVCSSDGWRLHAVKTLHCLCLLWEEDLCSMCNLHTFGWCFSSLPFSLSLFFSFTVFGTDGFPNIYNF